MMEPGQGQVSMTTKVGDRVTKKEEVNFAVSSSNLVTGGITVMA